MNLLPKPKTLTEDYIPNSDNMDRIFCDRNHVLMSVCNEPSTRGHLWSLVKSCTSEWRKAELWGRRECLVFGQSLRKGLSTNFRGLLFESQLLSFAGMLSIVVH
jgi:hypothetical protein